MIELNETAIPLIIFTPIISFVVGACILGFFHDCAPPKLTIEWKIVKLLGQILIALPIIIIILLLSRTAEIILS